MEHLEDITPATGETTPATSETTPATGKTPLPGKGLSRDAMIPMAILGMDWGARRIGLAIKPAGQDWALPQRVASVRNEAGAIDLVLEAIKSNGAQAIVVGLPLNNDPTQADQIRRFCRKARRNTRGVRWFFTDERLTTQHADSLSVDRPSHKPTDDLAAALILESFLNQCR